ncbi:hypothetical protein ACXO4P_09160, partial [Lactobacillus delbrueckii subsp. bulgaricus]
NLQYQLHPTEIWIQLLQLAPRVTICMMNLLMASGLTNYVEWSYILITGVFIRRTESERVKGNAIFNNNSCV